MDEMLELMRSISGSLNDPYNAKLPAPQAITYYKNMQERRLWIEEEIDNRILEDTKNIIRWNIEDKNIPVEERKPIWIYIQNYGGSVDYMWMLIDMIRASKTPVYTVNMGVAASAAAIIFIAGHKRFMTKSANVTIHEGSAQFSGDATKIIDQTDSYKNELKRMKEFILEHTNIPKTQLNKKRSNDWIIDANYCLENGVCDKIVEDINDII